MNQVREDGDLHHLQVVYCVSTPPINGPITRPSCETRPSVSMNPWHQISLDLPPVRNPIRAIPIFSLQTITKLLEEHTGSLLHWDTSRNHSKSTVHYT